jgi:hypothetical protein
VYRQLSAADRAAFNAGLGLSPKGVGGTAAEHVAGTTQTGYISASLSEAATAAYSSRNGLVAIDVDATIAAGTGYIEHGNVLQILRRSGDFRVLRNAERAQEVLFRGGVPWHAMRLVRDN